MSDNIVAEDSIGEINLKQLFLIFWGRRILIAAITTCFALFSVFYAMSLNNVYTSSALLTPTQPEDYLNSKLGNFNLSSLRVAGVDLQGMASTKSQIAVASMQSYEFFLNHFLPYINLENLTAVRKWDSEENSLTYNEGIFNERDGTWVKGFPSSQKAYKIFQSKFTVSEDFKTGFTKISVNHISPFVAQKWADIIITNINESLREDDKEAAEYAINFLQEKSSLNNVQSIQQVISSLLENQMQTLMLASSNEAYVFKIIDSPIVSEEKSSPNRALTCILITFLGGVFSLAFVLFIHYRNK